MTGNLRDMRAIDIGKELKELTDSIETPEIKEFLNAFMGTIPPAAFWTREASLRHHPNDERGISGNAIHTIRVIRITKILCEAANASQVVTDAATCAAAIHDTGRHGESGEEISSNPDHPMFPRRMAEQYNLCTPFTDPIFDAVETHMGKWGDPPYTPMIGLQEILHIADVIAAHLQEIYD